MPICRRCDKNFDCNTKFSFCSKKSPNHKACKCKDCMIETDPDSLYQLWCWKPVEEMLAEYL